MAEKLAKWASNRGLISKIRPSDGCKGDTVPSTVVRGYDLCKPGGYLGNVGLRAWLESSADPEHFDPNAVTTGKCGSHP